MLDHGKRRTDMLKALCLLSGLCFILVPLVYSHINSDYTLFEIIAKHYEIFIVGSGVIAVSIVLN